MKHQCGTTRYAAVVSLLLVCAVLTAVGSLPLSVSGAITGGSGGKTGGGGSNTGGGGFETPPRPVSSYLSQLYVWFLGFVGIAALFAFTVGGVMWMLSSSLTSTDQARKWITNGIWGIVIAAASFLLLNTINPELVGGFDINAVIDTAIKSKLQKPASPGINAGVEG